jgi:hypothetical protein
MSRIHDDPNDYTKRYDDEFCDAIESSKANEQLYGPITAKQEIKREIKRARVHVRKLAQEHSQDAIAVIYELMMTSLDENLRFLAAKEMLDRGWGKPPIMLANDPENPLPTMQVVQLFKLPDNERDPELTSPLLNITPQPTDNQQETDTEDVSGG